MQVISKCVLTGLSEDTFFGLDTAGDTPVVPGPYMKSITVF
jgi:hypothetical protein